MRTRTSRAAAVIAALAWAAAWVTCVHGAPCTHGDAHPLSACASMHTFGAACLQHIHATAAVNKRHAHPHRIRAAAIGLHLRKHVCSMLPLGALLRARKRAGCCWVRHACVYALGHPHSTPTHLPRTISEAFSPKPTWLHAVISEL